MRTRTFITLMAIALGLSSCQMIQSIPVKTIGIGETGVIQTPVLAELEVSATKYTQTIQVKKAKTPDEAKMMAVAQVLKDTKSDVLVEPQYELTRKGGKTFVTVTSYPALYRNFRSMIPEDEYILEHMRFRRAEVTEGSAAMMSRKKRR